MVAAIGGVVLLISNFKNNKLLFCLTFHLKILNESVPSEIKDSIRVWYVLLLTFVHSVTMVGWVVGVSIIVQSV